jgi:MFS superfamily sulfate permease-like transporter
MSETTTSPPGREREGLRWNAWNLLLLVPFLMIVTPWWNSVQPMVFGMPFFYWIQFVFVVVGVACVWLVYAMTKDEPVSVAEGEPLDVDQLDEGTAR